MPRKLFYYHPTTGESGASHDVAHFTGPEIFALNFDMLNKAEPGWIVVDSHDAAEMARVQAGI